MPMPPLLDRARRRGLALVTLWALVQGAAAGAAAFALRGLFESLHAGSALPWALLLVLGGAGLVIALARIAAAVRGERIGQAYALDLRRALFAHAMRMPASDIAQRRNGYMSLRFVGDMSALRDWLAQGLPQLIAAAILIPVALAVLWWLHPGFSRALLPLFAFGLLGMWGGGAALLPLHNRLRHRRARIAADMAERMPLAPHLARLGRGPTETAQVVKRSEAMIDAALDLRRQSEALKALPDLLSGVAALLLIWIGHRDGLSTGTIAAGLAALGIALGPMRTLAQIWNMRAAFTAAHSKCAVALSRRQKPRPAKHRQKQKTTPLAVEVRGLSLGKLENFSLAIAAGERLVLDRLHCPDETQLVSALMGLEIPRSGEVRLGGKPLARVDQGRITVISADPVVLRGSLRRAITLGVLPRPPDSAILKAAREASFAGVIGRLGGLDGQISEGARSLSLRERAALSLTRAMLTRPGLIIISRSAQLLPLSAAAAMMDWAERSGATLLLGSEPRAELAPVSSEDWPEAAPPPARPDQAGGAG